MTGPPLGGLERRMAPTSDLDHQQQLSGGGPPLLLDRYILGEIIGRGGMASVYRATDTMLGRAVAVKLLHPSVSRDPLFVVRRHRQPPDCAAAGFLPPPSNSPRRRVRQREIRLATVPEGSSSAAPIVR